MRAWVRACVRVCASRFSLVSPLFAPISDANPITQRRHTHTHTHTHTHLYVFRLFNTRVARVSMQTGISSSSTSASPTTTWQASACDGVTALNRCRLAHDSLNAVAHSQNYALSHTPTLPPTLTHSNTCTRLWGAGGRYLCELCCTRQQGGGTGAVHR